MLKIGINEDQVLHKVSILEGQYPAIEFNFGAGADPATLNPFSQEVDEQGMAATGGGGSSIRVFVPKPADELKADKVTVLTAMERAQSTLAAVTEVRNLLQQFALCYTTSDKINLSDYTRNTGITPENWVTGILNEAVTSKMTKNLVEDFNKSVGEYLGKPEDKLRLICVRNSKGYAEFRRLYIKDNPVVESMKVPLVGTKLKFTKWEIDKGLNTDTPIPMTPDVIAEDPTINAVSIFGNQAAAAPVTPE